MTHAEAIDLIDARTGLRHDRYRWLCSDANPDRHSRDGYRALVIRRAARGESPSPSPAPGPPSHLVPLGESIRAARLGFRVCFYSDSRGCGCSGTFCHALGRHATLRDCVACLATEKGPPQ